MFHSVSPLLSLLDELELLLLLLLKAAARKHRSRRLRLSFADGACPVLQLHAKHQPAGPRAPASCPAGRRGTCSSGPGQDSSSVSSLLAQERHGPPCLYARQLESSLLDGWLSGGKRKSCQ